MYKKRALGGLTSIQALIKALSDYGSDDPKSKYYFAHKEDDSNCVKCYGPSVISVKNTKAGP